MLPQAKVAGEQITRLTVETLNHLAVTTYDGYSQ